MSTLLLAGFLLFPVLVDSDDFPLSTYPMYSSARGQEVSFVTAYGIDAAGESVALGIGTIGGTDDPLIATGELRSAIRLGQAADRCGEIASRVDPNDGITVVEVVTERHDVIEHTLDRSSIVERTVHATCRVES